MCGLKYDPEQQKNGRIFLKWPERPPPWPQVDTAPYTWDVFSGD